MKLSEAKTVSERAAFLEKTLSLSLKNVKGNIIDPDEKVHCENRVGSVLLPLGVAGPVLVAGEHAKGDYYVPLATTEGALVASVSRGMKATHEKGILSVVQKVGVTRGPVLQAKTIGGASKIEKWIWEHMPDLATQAQKTSSHIKLMDLTVKKAGMYLFIRFSFDTDKAMGMNMATIASQQLVEHIAKKTNSLIVTVAGNYDTDKKPSWLNSMQGRGYMVNAEAIVSGQTVEKILKTTPQEVFNVWKAKCLIGSAVAGSLGFNAHHANIVAAFYAATGQDLAHVVEGSLGMTIVDVLDEGSLYISVSLPSILLGTVGGGTKLITQTEARSLMKSDSPSVLAEVLGAVVLAGELSLLSSLSEGSLASAHKALGR